MHTLRLSSIEHDGKSVPLIDPALQSSRQNTFTVLVGRNGVGKSRLLSTIAKQCIGPNEAYVDDGWPLSRRTHGAPVVIAASTSPFDKFPTPPRKRDRLEKNYRYVGMRGESMYAATSSISLLSSVTRGLLSKLLLDSHRADLIGVFRSLSFVPGFEFVLKPVFSHKESPQSKKIESTEGRGRYYIDSRYESNFSRMSTEDRSAIEHAIENVGEVLKKRKVFALRVDFLSGESSIDRHFAHAHQINSILMLMDAGLIRLMDVRTAKDGLGEISLRGASSGEQCILVLMLGIASYIENGSLILIDEPEISLHPEWQEDFMGMLDSAFSRYKGCQFIIATHSPQITSKLIGANSFVYSLSKGRLICASEFSNKSADFQLAELFESPGNMNEYISRLSFDLVAQIRAGKRDNDSTRGGLAKLLELQSKIPSGDPTIALIDSVKELYRQYA